MFCYFPIQPKLLETKARPSFSPMISSDWQSCVVVQFVVFCVAKYEELLIPTWTLISKFLELFYLVAITLKLEIKKCQHPKCTQVRMITWRYSTTAHTDPKDFDTYIFFSVSPSEMIESFLPFSDCLMLFLLLPKEMAGSANSSKSKVPEVLIYDSLFPRMSARGHSCQ